jgi:hypothetical protein
MSSLRRFLFAISICFSQVSFGYEIGCYFSNLDPFHDIRPEDGKSCPSVDQILSRYRSRYPYQDPNLAKTPAERKLSLDALKVASGINERIVVAINETGTPRLLKPLQLELQNGSLTPESLLHIFRKIRLDFSYSENELLRGLVFLLDHELNIAKQWGPSFSAMPILAAELSKLPAKNDNALVRHYQEVQRRILEFDEHFDLQDMTTERAPLILYTPKINQGLKPEKNFQLQMLIGLSKRIDEQRACSDFGPDGDARISRTAFFIKQLISEAAFQQAQLDSRIAQKEQEHQVLREMLNDPAQWNAFVENIPQFQRQNIFDLKNPLIIDIMQRQVSALRNISAEGPNGLAQELQSLHAGMDLTRFRAILNQTLAQSRFDIERLRKLSEEPADEANLLISTFSLNSNLTFERAYDALVEKLCRNRPL